MTGGTGGQRDRGLSSTAGIILFVLIGALLTASGTYLMLEIGSGEIGRTVTTTFDVTQNGETVVIEHTTGSALDSDNLRVVGATDEDGEFVTIPATRDGLEAGQEYVVLAATAGPDAERAYAVGSVTIDERENVVRLVLPE